MCLAFSLWRCYITRVEAPVYRFCSILLKMTWHYSHVQPRIHLATLSAVTSINTMADMPKPWYCYHQVWEKLYVLLDQEFFLSSFFSFHFDIFDHSDICLSWFKTAKFSSYIQSHAAETRHIVWQWKEVKELDKTNEITNWIKTCTDQTTLKGLSCEMHIYVGYRHK